MKKFRNISIILFAIYIALVAFVCFFNFSDTDLDLPKSFLGIPMDKVVHFVMFMPFPISFGLVLLYSKYKYRNVILFTSTLVFVIGLCFAASTEILQTCITDYRSGDLYDLVADTCGLLFGTLILGFFYKYLQNIFEFIFTLKHK